MPPVDLPRGNAAKPPPPARTPSPVFQAVHGYALPPAPRVKPAPTKVVLRPPAAPKPSPVFQAIHGSPAPYKPDPAAIVHVFRAQPPKIQQAIVKGAIQTASVPASKIILQYIRQSATGPQTRFGVVPINTAADTSVGSLLGKGASALSGAMGGIEKGLSFVQAHGGPAGAQLGGFAPPSVGRVLVHAPADVVRATVEDPSVVPKTLKGLADSTAGMVAGVAELPIRAVQEGPLKAAEQLGKGIAADYSRRYGPLAAGNDRAFINRIKKEGAGPELFDALGVAGGADATLGRAASSLAKTRKALTGEENFLTRPRPNLLMSGNKVRPQTIAPTALRATAQRLEDYIRSKRGGELVPKKGQIAPIFQSHAIRVVHSGIAQKWRRALQENLNREVRGYRGSALQEIGKLSNVQQQAIFHAIHGVRMDTADHLREDLAARAQQILRERATNPKSLGNRIPPQYVDKVDELKLIQKVSANAEKIAGPKMVAFQRGEAERARRIEAATALHPATAEARRLRPIGERLGIEHPDEVAARRVAELKGQRETLVKMERNPASIEELRSVRQALSDNERALATAQAHGTRQQALADYNERVRAGMGNRIPEPGYFKHNKRPDVKYGDFTSGPGARAMSADKRSTFALYKAGVAHTTPDAYLQGLARSIKRPLQWRLTDEQYRAAALGTPTRDEIKQALGHAKAPHLLTGDELRTVLEHRGTDMSKVMFYNPGRLAERTLAEHDLLPRGKAIAETHDTASGEIHDALQQEDVIQRGDRLNDRFLTTQGLKAVPRTAHEEIHGSLKANSLLGRSVGKVQGTTAKLILGQNPHFVIINTLAHAVPAVAGTKGRILADLGKFPLWWHGLSDKERDLVRGYAGGRGGHFATTARLGSQAPNKIATFGRQLEAKGLVQAAQRVNPFHALLRAEDLQSNFFRHAVMYHEMKRQAFQDMGHEFGRAVGQWQQVKHVFQIKDPQERMRAIMNDATKMEELGRTTVNILGDYGRFTNRERQFFNNRAVLFYSFLRHVTRTLLYVLPVRHPLALALTEELGNLHVQEVKKLLGGQDLPWAYGRLFFKPGGKLSSVDLTATSPISSPLVNVLSGGAKELPGLLSPALAPILDVAYGQTPIGQPVQRNALSYVNDLLSLSYPYRMAAAGELGLAPQQSDSIAFLHERPKKYKTAKAQAYATAKEQARGPLKQYLLGTTLGLYPKPDDSAVVAQHVAATAPKGSGGGYVLGSGGGASGGGGGGYVLGSGGGSSGSSGYVLGSGQ